MTVRCLMIVVCSRLIYSDVTELPGMRTANPKAVTRLLLGALVTSREDALMAERIVSLLENEYIVEKVITLAFNDTSLDGDGEEIRNKKFSSRIMCFIKYEQSPPNKSKRSCV